MTRPQIPPVFVQFFRSFQDRTLLADLVITSKDFTDKAHAKAQLKKRAEEIGSTFWKIQGLAKAYPENAPRETKPFSIPGAIAPRACPVAVPIAKPSDLHRLQVGFQGVQSSTDKDLHTDVTTMDAHEASAHRARNPDCLISRSRLARRDNTNYGVINQIIRNGSQRPVNEEVIRIAQNGEKYTALLPFHSVLPGLGHVLWDKLTGTVLGYDLAI